MRKLQQFLILGIFAFFLAAIIMASGCSFNASKPSQSRFSALKNITASDIEIGPCGIFHIQKPLFNVTGFLTAAARPNSSIHLFVVPDTTFGSALYVVQHCPSLFKEPIYSEKYFRFDYLPAGNYVAMVPRSLFYASQGFPIINEFNRSNYSARVNFHGGDYRYSLGSFSIFPLAEEPKTEK